MRGVGLPALLRSPQQRGCEEREHSEVDVFVEPQSLIRTGASGADFPLFIINLHLAAWLFRAKAFTGKGC
jgi:hypothetical protein